MSDEKNEENKNVMSSDTTAVMQSASLALIINELKEMRGQLGDTQRGLYALEQAFHGATLVRDAGVPVPKPHGSPLASKKLHLNDVSALAVLARRQGRVPSPGPLLSSSAPSAEELPLCEPLLPSSPPEHNSSAPVPLPKVYDPSLAPTATTTPTSTAAAMTGAVQDRLFLPGSDSVWAALHSPPVMLSPPLLSSAHDDSSALPSNPQRLAAATHRRRSSFIDLFKASNPKRGALDESTYLSEQPAGVAVDGGFLTHQANFSGRPLFGSATSHMVEAYAGSDGAWPYAASVLVAPAFVRPVFAEMEKPRLWVWEAGLFVVAARLTSDGEQCELATVGPHGFTRTRLDIPNLRVMSSREIARRLLVAANPSMAANEAVRVRGVAAQELWSKLVDYERATVRRVFDVDFCNASSLGAGNSASGTSGASGMSAFSGLEGVSLSDKRSRRSSLASSKGITRSGAAAALFAVTQQTADTAGEVLSYFWNEAEIRVHLIRSLTQATHPVVLCSLDDASTIISPASASNSSARVLLALRDAGSQKFELACCSRRDVPAFGPPFFSEPVKERAVQALVTAKILHAFDALHDAQQLSPEREAALRAIVAGALSRNK